MNFKNCSWCNGFYHGKMNTEISVQIFDKAVCISHSTDKLFKSIHPNILPKAMCKL